MRKGYWIVLVVTFWSILVLGTIPASWAIYIAQQFLPNWQVVDVSGNFWQGSAKKNQLLIDNKPFPLGEFTWQLNPIGLLWLTPCIRFSSGLQGQTLLANACLSLISYQWQLQNSQLVIDVAELEPWSTVRLRGSADIILESVVLKDGHFDNIDGVIRWRQAQFHNSQTWIDVGELQVDLKNDTAGSLQGQLTDVEPGPLTVNLTIRVQKEGGFSVSGEVAPTSRLQPAAHEALHQTLQAIGNSNNQGVYTIDWNNR